MDDPIIQVLMRYLHIVSAIAAMGGMVFLAACLLPVVRLLDDGFSESWMKVIRKRFHRLLWVSIGGLAITGVYNWVMLAEVYKAMGSRGNMLIGIKVLLAVIMFVMVWVGSVGLLKPKVCQMINLHLAAAVILIAAALRHFRLEHMETVIALGGG